MTKLMYRQLIASTIAIAITGGSVLAEEAAHKKTTTYSDDLKPSWSYLYDGGVIPFVYGAFALRLGVDLWAPARSTPWLFSADEGGAPSLAGGEVPTWVVQAGTLGLGVTLALIPDRSRWFHIKGFAESLSTTVALTGVTKHLFSRHRPDYVPNGNNGGNDNLSFFSGHTSATLSSTTYLALYLRYHGFDAARGSSAVTGWEALSYAGLLGVSVYIPYSRVVDNRHHVSDVLTGGAVGIGTSLLFFYWQEARYKRALFQTGSPLQSLQVIPDIANRGISASLSW